MPHAIILYAIWEIFSYGGFKLQWFQTFRCHSSDNNFGPATNFRWTLTKITMHQQLHTMSIACTMCDLSRLYTVVPVRLYFKVLPSKTPCMLYLLWIFVMYYKIHFKYSSDFRLVLTFKSFNFCLSCIWLQ